MARQRGQGDMFTPVKGLVTEFTDTRFPADAAIDCMDVIFDKDGSTRRRPGVNLEGNYKLNLINGVSISDTSIGDIGIAASLWEAVSNSGTLDIVVVQVGTVLQFYAQFGTLSQNLLGEYDFTAHVTDLVRAPREVLQMDSGIGNLYVVGKYLKPIQISYDGTNFTVVELSFEERDFDGVDDGLAIDERPAQLTVAHYYNLRNQGWTDENINIFAGLDEDFDICGNIALDSPIDAGMDGMDTLDFPSNADIMYLGFTTNNDGDPVFERSALTEEHFVGNTPAPKGHFILDPFVRDRVAALGCAGVGIELVETRPEALAFHNGRIFFTRPNVQNKPNGIYYSRTLTREELVNEVRPEADPTAEDINDLVATDGGYIPTPGVGQIYILRELGNGVLVGASNGVWFLTGLDVDSGFTATSNRLVRISKSGMLSSGSYIEAENQGFYFGVEGIMGVSLGDVNPTVTNLSENTIQTLYINISAEARSGARGVYIPEQRKVFWFYQSGSANDAAEDRSKNLCLVFDLNIQGFYPYTIGKDVDDEFPEIHDVTLVKPLALIAGQETVTTNDGTPVTLDDGTTLVTIDDAEAGTQITTLKMLTMLKSVALGGWVVTFSTFSDRLFADWRYFDPAGTGIDYSSFVEFGYNTFGTPNTRGKPTYVHSYFSKTSKNLEPGGYYELPPAYQFISGLRVSQSVLEVLNKPSANLRVTQSVLEVLNKPAADLRVTQSVVEVLHAL